MIIKGMWKCAWWPKRIYAKGLAQEYKKDNLTLLQCASSEQQMISAKRCKAFKCREVQAARQVILFPRDPNAYYLETYKNQRMGVTLKRKVKVAMKSLATAYFHFILSSVIIRLLELGQVLLTFQNAYT